MEKEVKITATNDENEVHQLVAEEAEEFIASRNLYQDLAMSGVLAAFGLTVIILSFLQKQPDYSFEPIGLIGLPLTLGVIVLGLSIWLGVQNLLKIRKGMVQAASDRSADDEAGIPATPKRPFIIMGICIAWMLLTPVLGFLITTPLAIFFSLHYMEYRKYGIAIATSLIFTGLCFYLFGVLLGAPIPEGITDDFLRMLGI